MSWITNNPDGSISVHMYELWVGRHFLFGLARVSGGQVTLESLYKPTYGRLQDVQLSPEDTDKLVATIRDIVARPEVYWVEPES
jgi:hypothetical protein